MVGWAAVRLAERIDTCIEAEITRQQSNTSDKAEHDIDTPLTTAQLIDNFMDVPSTEAVIILTCIAPSVVCYCGLPVAKYKIKKATSLFQGQWFLHCLHDHINDTQCSFYRLIRAPPAWATQADWPNNTNDVRLYCL